MKVTELFDTGGGGGGNFKTYSVTTTHTIGFEPYHSDEKIPHFFNISENETKSVSFDKSPELDKKLEELIMNARSQKLFNELDVSVKSVKFKYAQFDVRKFIDDCEANRKRDSNPVKTFGEAMSKDSFGGDFPYAIILTVVADGMTQELHDYLGATACTMVMGTPEMDEWEYSTTYKEV